ncbi:MAG TPA: hypothetical protein VHV47_14695 [Opitutaceae bacterium]|jgi:hypothetical protein|nr:hypothetical protein [Opitutaceae bacterium]
MKARFALFLTLGAWLVVGLYLAWHGLQSARDARDQLAAAVQRRADLEAGLQQVQSHLAQDRQAAGQLRAKARAARPSPSVAAAAAPGLAMIVSHPQLYKAFLDYFRASLSLRFGPFYKMMGLSPDQIAKFEDLQAKAQSDQLDLMGAAFSAHQSLDDPSFRSSVRARNTQLAADESTLLGPQGLQQLQEYNRSQVAAAVTMQAANLALDSEPITNEQAAKVIQAVAAASPSYQKGGQINPQTVDWDAATSQAGAILSASQLEAFKSTVDMIHLGAMLGAYSQAKK